MSRSRVISVLVSALCGLASAVPVRCQEASLSPAAQRCQNDPEVLREKAVFEELRKSPVGERSGLMRRIAVDPDQAWDIRARALTLLRLPEDSATFRAFVSEFRPEIVARQDRGAEAFNFLADWLPRSGPARDLIRPLLVPEEREGRVNDVLGALAGQSVHDYLVLLHREQHRFQPDTIVALAETDDQDTRRFLSWYVGQRSMAGMERFLVDQIASSRPSSYPSQARRLFEAAFTAGISELIRAAAPEPTWLGEEASPKGLALSSLAVLVPVGQQLGDRELAGRLLKAAVDNAGGKDRCQWRLASRILEFLHDRGEPLAPSGVTALDRLARQVLRKCGPIDAFVLAEGIHRVSGLALPELTEHEQAQIWEVASKTLNARFLGAVTRVFPDAERRRRLELHLLGLADQAARGSLRLVRCWGADIEGPGDWCLAVAKLRLEQAVGGVEQVLESAWSDEAVEALVKLGPGAAPPLARFLRTRRADQVAAPLLLDAVRHCARHLDVSEFSPLALDLLADRHKRDAARQVLLEQGEAGAQILASAPKPELIE